MFAGNKSDQRLERDLDADETLYSVEEEIPIREIGYESNGHIIYGAVEVPPDPSQPREIYRTYNIDCRQPPIRGEPFCACIRYGDDEVICHCAEESKDFDWIWDRESKSLACTLTEGDREVEFHSDYSCGTAAVRGTLPMESDQYFWEIKMTTPVYGTDMMVGVGTDKVAFDMDRFKNTFCSFLGRDAESWGLSYTGQTHHAGRPRKYSGHFTHGSIVGMHLNMWTRTLTLYKNRKLLGTPFKDMRGKVMYPVVTSTAARSGMKLITSQSFKTSLQFMACQVLRNNIPAEKHVCDVLSLPPGLREYLRNSLGWLMRPCVKAQTATVRAYKKRWHKVVDKPKDFVETSPPSKTEIPGLVRSMTTTTVIMPPISAPVYPHDTEPSTSTDDRSATSKEPSKVLSDTERDTNVESETTNKIVENESNSDSSDFKPIVQKDISTPSDDTLISPTPPDDISPTPPDSMSPTLLDDISPTPPDDISPTSPDDISPTPPDDISPTPPDDISPTPPDDISPTPPDDISSTPPDGISPSPPHDISPTPPDDISPTPPDDTAMSQEEASYKDTSLNGTLTPPTEEVLTPYEDTSKIVLDGTLTPPTEEVLIPYEDTSKIVIDGTPPEDILTPYDDILSECDSPCKTRDKYKVMSDDTSSLDSSMFVPNDTSTLEEILPPYEDMLKPSSYSKSPCKSMKSYDTETHKRKYPCDDVTPNKSSDGSDVAPLPFYHQGEPAVKRSRQIE